ncbi:histidine kinase [Mycobacterium adipatum]|uniref:histidine kinase n=1 Tax=Mycobacterium adipatum TaxID=1682113 RepID=A0A172USB6_9MYCO|nr:ATP-binding protein [Mycobacterium adipatum]ANE82059.1 histidine kinase [Mycobacterium adipatum]MBI5734967.1 cyclic nucleotide-binding domain-containing protein [Mycolicibacterium neoaurum]
MGSQHGEECVRDELRTLFLFEHLSDEQLDILCEAGHIETFPAGPIVVEGERATCFYVLIDGELVMSKRSGGVDIQTNRTSQRGVYFGAWSAYIPGEEQLYQASVRLVADSRIFVLQADTFAEFMRTQFPMAVHLMEGQLVGGRRQSQIIGQREKLLALGTITAGLTHQLNNPAAATARAVADLREGVGHMRHKLAMVAEAKFTPEALRVLVNMQDQVAEQVAKNKGVELSALETSDREDELGDWLEDHNIIGAWDYAPTFVEAGLDTDWLERVAAVIEDSDSTASLQGAIGWLKYTIDNELRMNEIAEASKRISALLAGAKQYSQMDRGSYGSADVHELLRSTIMMFGDKIGGPGKGKPVSIVKDLDKTLPELQCYPGDLNQVWTNIIDNAIQAMDGHGTLTIRTARENEQMIRVEICDDGPGIPEDVIERIFTPFFTTKPFGEGTGLGLDLAWRIVVEKHGGNISVQSRPGDTRFAVCLPLVAPAPLTPTPGQLSAAGTE